MNSYEQYLICKDRGHVSDNRGWINDGKVVWYTCKYCGTKFGTHTSPVEKIPPTNPKPLPNKVDEYRNNYI